MNLRLLLVTVFFIGLVAVSFAGPPPPPPPNSGPPCWPPPCIPIDGGITLLMAAGAAFGAKKIYDSRKKIESND
ncbi:MAG: PID-CTERM protein-sorting domain-containing protein [Sphingobacteriaceae bacterium]